MKRLLPLLLLLAIPMQARPAIPGYLTASSDGHAPLAHTPGGKWQRDENCDVARFANLLHHYDGDAKHEAMARNAMRYLAAPEVAAPASVGSPSSRIRNDGSP